MPFDLQPDLRGELVRVRPLRPDDWDALYAVAADPLIWEQHPAFDRYKEEVFREFFRDALACGGGLVVLDAKDGRVIGSSRYYGYDEGKSEVEIGWTFLARSHWGGAANRELKALMLGHAFRFVERVIFKVGPQNWRSQRAMEKIGGRRVGIQADDTGRESVVFELRRSERSQRWFDRKFELGLAPESAPALLVRLGATAERLAQATRAQPRELLVRRPAPDKWSIQEHVGHLLDLETLWDKRLDDYDAGAELLHVADLTNRKTHEAGHNERPLANILADFAAARNAFVQRLAAMSPAELSRTGLHPRLLQPMSVVDLCFFVAEHDDHHLRAIEELKRTGS